MSESIFQSKSTTVKINDRDFEFYPTRIQKVLKLRKFSEDLAGGVMGFMTKEPTEYAGRTLKGDEVTINDIDQEKIDKYTSSKAAGLQKIISTLLEEKNMGILLDLICDSLREESITAEQLMNDGDLEYLIAMAMGLFEANSSVVDPILGKLQARKMETDLPESN